MNTFKQFRKSIGVMLLAGTAAHAAAGDTVTVDLNQQKAISPLLMGIFYEDLSYAADGGLYAELIEKPLVRLFPFGKSGVAAALVLGAGKARRRGRPADQRNRRSDSSEQSALSGAGDQESGRGRWDHQPWFRRHSCQKRARRMIFPSSRGSWLLRKQR